MQNYTPLVPGIYLCLFLAIYLFFPSEKRAEIQERMRRNINFLLICNLVLVAISISAAMMLRTLTPDYIAWGALVVLSGVSLWKIFSEPTRPKVQQDEVDVLKGMKL